MFLSESNSFKNMHSDFRTLIASAIIFYISISLVFSQDTDSLLLLENQLLKNYLHIMEVPGDKRNEASEDFYKNFTACLNVEGSFDYPFETLENIGKIYSPDHRLRILTWNIASGNSENMYFGIIQFYSSLQKKYCVISLNSLDSLNKLNPQKAWNASLYYKIIESKHAGQKYYTLLGYDLNTPLSNKKLIDVISIDEFDELYFCEKLIQYNGHIVDRIVFEYNEKAIMSLQYNEGMKMIVFDHLSPSRPSLSGQYEFYGPDFTYDGLKWEKGMWVHYSNIDVTN